MGKYKKFNKGYSLMETMIAGSIMVGIVAGSVQLSSNVKSARLTSIDRNEVSEIRSHIRQLLENKGFCNVNFAGMKIKKNDLDPAQPGIPLTNLYFPNASGAQGAIYISINEMDPDNPKNKRGNYIVRDIILRANNPAISTYNNGTYSDVMQIYFELEHKDANDDGVVDGSESFEFSFAKNVSFVVSGSDLEILSCGQEEAIAASGTIDVIYNNSFNFDNLESGNYFCLGFPEIRDACKNVNDCFYVLSLEHKTKNKERRLFGTVYHPGLPYLNPVNYFWKFSYGGKAKTTQYINNETMMNKVNASGWITDGSGNGNWARWTSGKKPACGGDNINVVTDYPWIQLSKNIYAHLKVWRYVP